MQTLQLLSDHRLTTSDTDGVRVIDNTGERNDGYALDPVACQDVGSVDRIDNGLVVVTTLWTHEQRYDPFPVAPYTPESRLAGGNKDQACLTKPHFAIALVARALAAGIAFKAIVAGCCDGDHRDMVATLRLRQWPFMLSHGSTAARWAAVGPLWMLPTPDRRTPLARLAQRDTALAGRSCRTLATPS